MYSATPLVPQRPTAPGKEPSLHLKYAWTAFTTVLHSVASVPSPYLDETFTFFFTLSKGAGKGRPNTNSFELIFLHTPYLTLICTWMPSATGSAAEKPFLNSSLQISGQLSPWGSWLAVIRKLSFPQPITSLHWTLSV